jgi:ketosteroid isomerase-like protein
MRSDHTAQFIATRPYANSQERGRALYDHARRVMRARRQDPTSDLAKEPVLVVSGDTVYSRESFECLIGPHSAGAVFAADSTTHRVLNRNGEECATWLCVRHWSEYAREEGDADDLPTAEVRYSKAITGAK